MPTLIFTVVLIGGIITLFTAAFTSMSTNSKYRLGQTTDMELRQSQRGFATAVVTVAVTAAGMALILWLASDFFSSNSLAGESEEATTTPATTSTDTSDK